VILPSAQLSEVAEIIMGQAPPGDTYNKDKIGHPLIAGAGDFGADTPQPKRHTTAAGKISSKGDIVMCIRATIGDLNWSDDEYCLGRGVAALRVDKTIVDSKYLWWVLDFNKKTLMNLGRGATFKQINRGDIKNFEIPLPPMAEQKRIAGILDQADALRRARARALEKLNGLGQSIFYDMFGGGAGEMQKLTEFFNFTTGKLDSNAAKEGGCYPFFTCAKEDFEIDEYAFDQEALLLAGNNASADYSVKYYSGKFNAYQRTYVINLQDETDSYLYAKLALQNKLLELKHVSKGSNTKYLTMKIFERMEILKPCKEKQKTFERKFLSLETIIKAQKVALLNHENMFSALQQRAFRGEL